MTQPVKDFGSSSREAVQPIEFAIDGEIFRCAGRAPMGAIEDLLDLVNASEGMDLTGEMTEATPQNMALADMAIRKTMDFLDGVMLTESRERFAARMRNPDNPIDTEQVKDIATWLMECYAARPTTPPSPSSNGHGGPGTSSTDGAPRAESIPETSLSTASST